MRPDIFPVVIKLTQALFFVQCFFTFKSNFLLLRDSRAFRYPLLCSYLVARARLFGMRGRADGRFAARSTACVDRYNRNDRGKSR